MSPSDSETQNKKRNREAIETEGVFDSMFDIFMDFVDKTETTVSKQQIKRNAPAPKRVHHEEHEGFDNAGKEFNKLPPSAKADVLKELWGEIAGNLLERLPEEGKEEFLVRCFQGLYEKIPEESREKIDTRVKDVLSSSQVAATEATLSHSGGFPRLFRPHDVVQVGCRVRFPPIVGRAHSPDTNVE